MGPEGHTASLVPGDPVFDVSDRDVAITGVYNARRRMTLTYPVLERAHKLMFLITLLAAPLIFMLRYRPIAAPAGGPPQVHVAAD